MPLINNNSPEIFQDNIKTPPYLPKPHIDGKVVAVSKYDKKKVVVKKPLKPINFEYDVQDIEDDYKHFNINFQPTNTNIKTQTNYLNINNMSFKSLFQFEIHDNFENSYYNKYIYLTEQILDSIVDPDYKQKIVDLNTYKLILFINVCKNIIKKQLEGDEKPGISFQEWRDLNGYTKEKLKQLNMKVYDLYPEYEQKYMNNNNNNNKIDEYELYDEDNDIHIIKNYKKFYEGDFNTYFNNKYKGNSQLNNEIMGRIKLFNYHYDKIYPHTFTKNDNPKEYNKVSKNKSNLKTQYKKYLEGEDINTLNNIPDLKMIIYIIDNVEIN